MAAPTVIMRPIIDWSLFQTLGVDVDNMSNEMAYILGGKSAGTIKARTASDYTAYSFNDLITTITNHVNRDGRFHRLNADDLISSITPDPNGQILTGALIPGSNDVYVYVSYYEEVASTLTFLHAAAAGDTPTTVGHTEIHSTNINGVRVKCFKITTSNSYIFLTHRIASTANIKTLNIHFFRGDDAYVFNQASDKMVWGKAGGNGQAWTWLDANIPYTPYSGTDLLVPYYYDANADQLIEMSVISPLTSALDYGYSMVFQFNGQHYGPAGINLWDDDSMSERFSEMFEQDVVGIWRPGQNDASYVNSHTRAGSGDDTDGYNASLNDGTGTDRAYVIGLLNEIHSNNTDINPAQPGQESPVINLDYSYV